MNASLPVVRACLLALFATVAFGASPGDPANVKPLAVGMDAPGFLGSRSRR